jgi:cell division protein FtsW
MWHVIPGGETLRRWWNHPLANYALLLSTTMLLLVLGIVMVFSASNVVTYAAGGGVGLTVTQKQLMFAVGGLAAMVLISRASIPALRRAAPFLMIAAFVGLFLVFVPGIGVSVFGQRNWISFGGPFQFQPSELAKFAFVLWGADLLTRKQRMIHEWRHLIVPLIPVWLAIVFLIFLEGDMGTIIVMFPIMAALLFVAGAPARVFGVAAGGLFALVAVASVTVAYRMQRFKTWINPADDPSGAGYQIIHGQYGLATGGLAGTGLGASREKWGGLPEAHTDFIFAVIGEELGLIGSVSVLLMFAIIAIVAIRVARNTDSMFVRLATTGMLAWIVGQALINIGAVLGLLPITGLPLPMVSYGGSSLLMCMCAIGVLLAFARAEPQAADVLRARRGGDARTRIITPRVRH